MSRDQGGLGPGICGKYYLSFPEKNSEQRKLLSVYFSEIKLTKKYFPHIPGLGGPGAVRSTWSTKSMIKSAGPIIFTKLSSEAC